MWATRPVQFLDQVSTYLAKHAVWLKTRALLRRTDSGRDNLLQRPIIGTDIVDYEVNGTFEKKSGERYWNGYWPGAVAPSGAAKHIKTIKPTSPCWCWSGKTYETCHRPKELVIVNLQHQG